MRAVVQRVKDCTIYVDGRNHGGMDKGLLVYLGVGEDDTETDAEYLADKIINLRIYEDAEGKMNLSLRDMDMCGICVVSQFTLFGDARKGRRPSFSHAAPPDIGRKFYDTFCSILEDKGFPPGSGEFGASMEVEYTNLGPLTLLLDSKRLF
jgi:D-tyrosyl-tRNA(Tyr) deacylase